MRHLTALFLFLFVFLFFGHVVVRKNCFSNLVIKLFSCHVLINCLCGA